ncbi:glycosyltransferase family 4 protein [Patescibacteria group bacterium]|nr:glycosyltransferase family 4 protein [Patescibacteria group bacterium]
MKRVLIFSTTYHPYVGGAEIAIQEIAKRCTDIEFDLLTCRMSRANPLVEKVGRVTTYRLGMGIPLVDKLCAPFLGALKTLNLSRKHSYTAYWAMMVSYMSGAAYIANFLRFRNQTPIVLTLQEGDSEEHLTKRWFGLLNSAWKLALRNAHIVTVISAYLAVRARRFGCTVPIVTIPNGVDTHLFTGVLTKHNSTVLITTSRLVQKNGIDTVLRALPLMPGVRFRILGTGPDQKKLKNLAASLGILERVEFTGHVPYKAIPAHLHKADIFVRPSRSEGMGNSFVEAMAAGLPVIATQEGGIADFLFDAKRNPDKPTTGWAVDKDSPEQIAVAVREILEHPEAVERVKKAARDMVIKKYDWDLVARDMREKVFANLL